MFFRRWALIRIDHHDKRTPVGWFWTRGGANQAARMMDGAIVEHARVCHLCWRDVLRWRYVVEKVNG